MFRQLLTKKFFRENPYKEISTQRFVYSYLTIDGIEELARDLVLTEMGLAKERLEKIENEKEMIESEGNPEEIFQLLRKNIDKTNQIDLINKALEYEAEILPMVIEKLKRSRHDVFIENAIRLIARSQKDYTPMLQEQYHEIRNPYVQSMICIVLGFRGEENIIPWMMERFKEMKKMYPDETYDQGPLLALHELNYRFYKK